MTSFLHSTILDLKNDPANFEYAQVLQEYVLHLEYKELPVIFTTEHLALSMGVSPNLLTNITERSHSFYSSYAVRKKSGGLRWILAPNDILKYIQIWIKINILDKVQIHHKANGFVKKRSIKTNAQEHSHQEIVLNIDLYRFFDTVTSKRVYGLFTSLGYAKNLSYDLALLLCCTPPPKYWEEIMQEGIISPHVRYADSMVLPQGSPASPVITNIICSKLDKRFESLAQSLKCNYSRYADDISFSGNAKNIPSLNTIRKIIEGEGFFLNEKKVKYTRKNRRQLITGLVVNKDIRVPKLLKRQVATHLFFCAKFGVKQHLAFLEANGKPMKSNFKQWLIGNIYFISSIEQATGAKLLEKFQSIQWDF